ncbi:hypothetical protein GLYMA_05G173232v4 [Glycine max]|nr:hypothetical protein GLYMA_05G173232v4 [Glycine max]KAG5041123.1 hypothetical protein JHK85_013599 [Glycine max]KAH1134895.1 hypothetical protein GYH30_012959 [Glycine max]
MTKHIRATHAPVHGHIDVRPLFHVVVDIFHRSLSHPWLALFRYFASVLSGGDVHATTMGILGMLSSYSWDAKVVIALAANFKEFWLVAQLHATNRLAKSVAKLKHIHETL